MSLQLLGFTGFDALISFESVTSEPEVAANSLGSRMKFDARLHLGRPTFEDRLSLSKTRVCLSADDSDFLGLFANSSTEGDARVDCY